MFQRIYTAVWANKGVALSNTFPNRCHNGSTALCALDASSIRHFHLESPPCIHWCTFFLKHVLQSFHSELNLKSEAQSQTALTLSQSSVFQSNCAVPYITSPLWRLSGTGNSLLCIAVLQSRSISTLHLSKLPRFILTSPDTKRQLCHARARLRCRSYLLRRNEKFQRTVFMAHLDPNRNVPQSPPRRSVPFRWTFLLDERGWVAGHG